MPDVWGEGEYYIVLLEEAGYTQAYGMGEMPLTWQELRAWAECSGLSLSYLDFKILKKLSDSYAVELSHGTDKNRPAPYTQRSDDPEDVSNRLAEALRSLKGIKRKGN